MFSIDVSRGYIYRIVRSFPANSNRQLFVPCHFIPPYSITSHITPHSIYLILRVVCQLPIRGVSPEGVRDAVAQGRTHTGSLSVMKHELKVAYFLLLDAKRHKQRIADVVLAAQDCSRTPPAAGSSPRILGR